MTLELVLASALALAAGAAEPAKPAPKGRPAAAPAETAPAAKPKRPPRVLPGRDVELKTKDGWTLVGRHAPAKDANLTFILLHETGGRKENWYFLARAMERKGIGFLALDMRGHGGSQSPPPGVPPHWRKWPPPSKVHNEFNNMTLDVDAAVEYLATQGVLAPTIALGGADVGSSIALKYAAVHSQVPMLFMLSPGMSYREVLTVNAIRAYTKRPILLVVGADDNRSTKETAVLHHFAKQSAGAENTTLVTADREHGTKILVANKGIIGRILEWIEDPVQVQEPAVSTDTTGGESGPDPLPSDGELGAEPGSAE